MAEIKEQLARLRRRQEEKQAQKRAEQLGLPYLEPAKAFSKPEAVKLIEEKEARQGQMIAFNKRRKEVWLALTNPQNQSSQSVIKRLEKQGYQTKAFIASLSTLSALWRIYKQLGKPGEELTERFVIDAQTLKQFSEQISQLKEVSKEIKKLSAGQVSKIFEIILAGSIKLRASDLHLERIKGGVRLRYRIDGLLYDISRLPEESYHFVLSRIKLMAGLKLNLTTVTQNGRFSIQLADRKLEIRVSCLPGPYGESIVMRLLDPQSLLSLEELGLRKDLLVILNEEIKKPHGLIINTGPTGSGKTTTLYACLKKVNQPEIKIITLEDPIEYRLAGLTQTEIDPERGYDFAQGLKEILRHDPDVILIGEIRDKETCRTSLEAALTGHLIFSTLHTNDAAGAIPRLIKLGASPDDLSSSLNLIIAQRLVRRLCPRCKKAYQPKPEEVAKIKKAIEGLPSSLRPRLSKELKLYRPQGCQQCSQLGYWGRQGIFEMIKVNQEMKKAISHSAHYVDILEKAKEQGMISLYQDGILKVLAGITDLAEVERLSDF